jgi:hypothetical protein
VRDASTLGRRFTILAVCVVIRGCAIPVAWTVVDATKKGAGKPHWETVRATLTGTVPADWTVIVLADRGVYATWVYEAIQATGWHPFVRINRQGQSCLDGEDTVRLLSQVVTTHGQPWAGRVTCVTTRPRQLDCTLLARHAAGSRDPWLIVTDRDPAAADIAWYSLRTWVECGVTDSKRGGWHGEQTKMTDPARAAWRWLAIAVATLWTVAVGCAAEHAAEQAAQRLQMRQTTAGATRELRWFRRGRVLMVTALCLGQGLPATQFVPEPWPKRLDTRPDDAESHSKASR